VKALARGILLVILGSAWSASAAAAGTCGSSRRPWVSLTFADASWPPGFAEKVLGDLRAGARPARHRRLPRRDGAGQRSAARERAHRRARSQKRGRHRRDPRRRDGQARESRSRSRARAGRRTRLRDRIAVDELVWASWAEIALARKSRQKSAIARAAPPPEVVEGVESELPASGPAPKLGVRFAVEHYWGGQTLLGADAATLLPLGLRFALDFAAGGPRGAARERRGRRRVVERDRVRRGRALRLRAHGFRRRGAHAGAARGGRAVSRRRGRGRGRSRALGSHALRARGRFHRPCASAGRSRSTRHSALAHRCARLEATDAGQVVSGVSGAEFFAQLGFTIEL